jgi:hypothetical protein
MISSGKFEANPNRWSPKEPNKSVLAVLLGFNRLDQAVVNTAQRVDL